MVRCGIFAITVALGCSMTGCLAASMKRPVEVSATHIDDGQPVVDPPPAVGEEVSLPELPVSEKYKADAYIAAAAKLQALGKEKAVALLADFGKEFRSPVGYDGLDETRVAILCRMLFVARPNGEFRRPSLGAPLFVGPTGFKESNDWPAVFKEWPLEPIELVDGVPFLVVRGHFIAGFSEPHGEYLEYCVKNCDWNPEAFKPKTTEEKRKAVAKLVASPKWKEPLTEEETKRLASQIE
jgi:hypothetical protein